MLPVVSGRLDSCKYTGSMRENISSAESSESINIDTLQAIIFDFDGTLVDSEPVWKEVFVDLFLKDCGIALSKEVLWSNTGNGVDRSVQNISDHYDLGFTHDDVMDMMDKINDESHKRIINDLPLRPGARELFEWAHNRGIAMAVCTASTYDLISTFLNKHDVHTYFTEIISTVDVEYEKRKPHPYSYQLTLDTLGINADRAIAIEDAPKGVASAMAAGIVTLAITNPMVQEKVAEVGPMAQLQDFHQVLEFLVSES